MELPGAIIQVTIIDTNDIKYEFRDISNIFHPVIQNDIMTGFIQDPVFFTSLSLGCLEDISFNVNYNSSYMDRDQYLLTGFTEDRKEAIKAFFEKRDANFKGK